MPKVKESRRSKRSRFLRDEMVDIHVAGRGIRDSRVCWRCAKSHELFAQGQSAEGAYDDGPVAIGNGQTISQPYVVARMLEAAAIGQFDRVLEVGAGSGYLAALAAKLGAEVCAMERHEELVERARSRLRHLRVTTSISEWATGGRAGRKMVSSTSSRYRP